MILWTKIVIILSGDFSPNSPHCLFLDDSVESAERFVEESEAYMVDLRDFALGGRPHVRRHFPETWLWLDANMG